MVHFTQFGEDRYTQFRVIMVTDPKTHKHINPQTGPITIHCTTKLSAQCNNWYCNRNVSTFYWSWARWKWWWQLRVAKLSQIITTNKPTPRFLQARCPSCRATIPHSMDLLTPSSPGGIPTLSLTTNRSWLPWGKVAMPLISPLMPVPQQSNFVVLAMTALYALWLHWRKLTGALWSSSILTIWGTSFDSIRLLAPNLYIQTTFSIYTPSEKNVALSFLR